MSEFDKLSFEYENTLNRDISWSGENAEYFADYKAKCVKEHLGNDFKGSILDYGCGIGLVTKYLNKYFDRGRTTITGYDVSKESVKKAGEELKDINFVSDLEKIRQGSFDVVIMANVMHHVRPEERHDFLKNISAILKKNGHILIFEHNPYNPMTRAVVKKTIIDKDAVLMTLKEMNRILNDAEIIIFKKRYIVFFPRSLKALRFLEPFLGMIPIGAQYLCVAKHAGT